MLSAAEGSNMENVRQIYQAVLLLRLEGDMEGYEQPPALMKIAEQASSYVAFTR